jgi:dipeptidyl-peptidase-4
MKKITMFFLAILMAGPILAQKQITVEDFTTANKFRTKSVYGIRWMNDGQFYSALKDNAIVKYDVTTGNIVETILDGKTMEPVITIRDYEFSNDESQILLLTDRQAIYRRSFTAIYYVYNRANKTSIKLASGRQAYGTFSPDGTKVAFTRDNNLFFVMLSTMKEVQITSDGKFNSIINGSTDWVY